MNLNRAIYNLQRDLIINEAAKHTKVTIGESTKISLKGLISEQVYKDYLSYLVTMHKKFKKAVTIQDIRKAIENVLIQNGWGGPELDSKIDNQMSNKKVIQSLYYDLKNNEIPYILPDN